MWMHVFMDTKWRCDANNGFKCSYLRFYLTVLLSFLLTIRACVCVFIGFVFVLRSFSLLIWLPPETHANTHTHRTRITRCKHLVQIWLSRRAPNIRRMQRDKIEHPSRMPKKMGKMPNGMGRLSFYLNYYPPLYRQIWLEMASNILIIRQQMF